MNVYTVDDLRAIDSECVRAGISIQHLMGNAGRALARVIQHEFLQFKRLAILCGKGNNAGDAFAMAHHLSIPCDFYLSHPKNQCSEAAQFYFPDPLPHCTIYPLSDFIPDEVPPDTLIVDALVGTGFKPPFPDGMQVLIHALNAARLPVLSVDIPSGLNADTGVISSVAVRAEMTVTFASAKPGFWSLNGIECCGKIRVIDLNVPNDILEKFSPLEYTVFTQSDFKSQLPEISRHSYKNTFGRVIAVGGFGPYGGAIGLVSEAVMRNGAGMCAVVTSENNSARFLNAVIRHTLPLQKNGDVQFEINSLLPLKDWGDVTVIGPGFTTTAEAANLLRYFLSDAFGSKCFVVDADALNLVATLKLKPEVTNLIYTPHWGEAERLARAFGVPLCETPELMPARIAFAKNLAQKLNVTLLLKGPRTIVVSSDGQRVSLNLSGTPALATAGSGDVLSGMIAAWVARGVPSFEATCMAAFLHGMSVEKYPTDTRGLTADDIVKASPIFI